MNHPNHPSKRPEIVKEYNKQYYQKNKPKLLKMHSIKVTCPLCGKTGLNNQNLKKHMIRVICKKNRPNKPDEESVQQ